MVMWVAATRFVVLDAAAHNARNLYVAMTRGSKRLVICGREAVLQPFW
jgi:DNA helicase-2/ATP-dependent DNA helicase PcrA